VSDQGHTQSGVLYGMAIDIDKCTGCMACSIACQAENNVSFRPDESNKLRSITWLEMFYLQNGKEKADYRFAWLPRPCMQCNSPHHSPCTFVCPVNATVRDEQTGIVDHIVPRLHRLSVLYGGLSLPRTGLQLVGPGLAQTDGTDAQPQGESSHARRGGKVQLLSPSAE